MMFLNQYSIDRNIILAKRASILETGVAERLSKKLKSFPNLNLENRIRINLTFSSSIKICLSQLKIEIKQLASIMKEMKNHIFLTKNKKPSINVDFLKTDDMATNISVSKSFLEKNMEDIFKAGKHFTRASDARLLRWNVQEMHKWLKGEDSDETDKQLLSKLLD